MSWPLRLLGLAPRGTQILTSSDDNTARIWDIGLGLNAPPPWFIQLFEGIAGLRLNDQFVGAPVENREQGINDIKGTYLNRGDPKDPSVKWARRILSMEQ